MSSSPTCDKHLEYHQELIQLPTYIPYGGGRSADLTLNPTRLQAQTKQYCVCWITNNSECWPAREGGPYTCTRVMVCTGAMTGEGLCIQSGDGGVRVHNGTVARVCVYR